MKPFALYTLARVGVFLASCALVIGVWGLAADEVPLLPALLVGAVISAVASVFLLARLRNDFAASVQGRAERMSAKVETMRASEDADEE